MLEPSDDKACEFCLQARSLYTCPRCGCGYCSLTCYKGDKHMVCAEGFYKDSVMSELNSQTVDVEDKRKLIMTLQRMHDMDSNNSGSEDDITGEDIVERLNHINLDQASSEEIWQLMTPSEREDFEKSITDGRIGHLLTLWEPWWTVPPSVCWLSPSHHFCARMWMDMRTLPQPLREVPALSTLTSLDRLQHELQFNLIDLLFSYAYTLRAFNGEMEGKVEIIESSLCCMQLSGVLSCNAVHPSVEHAVHAFLGQAQQRIERGEQPIWDGSSALEDVSQLLTNSVFIVAALADLHRLLTRAQRACKSATHHDSALTKKNTTAPLDMSRLDSDTVNRLRQCTRKVWFFVAWANAELGIGNHITCEKMLCQLRLTVKHEQNVLAQQAHQIISAHQSQPSPHATVRPTVSIPAVAAAEPKRQLPYGRDPRIRITEIYEQEEDNQ